MEPDFDMVAFIQGKLAGMKSLEQKKALSDMMNDVFLALYEETEEKYERLQTRVRDELPAATAKYTMYTTVMRRSELDRTHSYLQPMIPGDLQPQAPAILAGEESVMDTVFLEMDSLQIEQALRKNNAFPGKIFTDKGEITATFQLLPSKRYMNEVYRLYQLFVFNQVPWQTLCIPYLFHFYDVVPATIGSHPEDASFSGIQVDFGELEAQIKRELIPVWNLDFLQERSRDFPMPAIDKQNYEYVFDLDEYGLVEDGVLVNETDDVLSVRSEQDRLIATVNHERGIVWNISRVRRRRNLATEAKIYPVFGNRKEDTFASRMLSHFGTSVKTRGELRRLLSSMEAFQHFELKDMQVIHDRQDGETYEANWFIEDEVRDIAVSKTLLLSFEKLGAETWYDRDLLSYYCSQLQLVYPEYHVSGILWGKGQFVDKEVGEGLPI